MNRKTFITTPHPSVREVAAELGVSVGRAKTLTNLMDSIASREARPTGARLRASKKKGPPNRQSEKKHRVARINWRNVLARLPKQFKVSQIKALPGVRLGGPRELSAALNRLVQSGSVERRAPGVFERVR